MAHKDVHALRPTCKASLSSFTRDMKAIINAAGSSSTRQAIACHKGKDLLLSDYGLYCHMSAIGATLCVEPAISIEIHNMLMAIRKAKGPTGDDMLKSTSLPLPKFEPWSPFIGKSSLSLPSLVLRRNAKHIEAIEYKGQGGEGKDTKAREFMLTCPKCKVPKDAARCKLYAAAARVLFCSSCRTSATSTRWHCDHGIPWHSCKEHRAWGFRCGGLRKPKRPQGSPPWPSTCPGSVSSRPGSRGSKKLAPSALAPRGQALIQQAAHQGPLK